MNDDRAYPKRRPPLGTVWASALLIMGGGLFLIPLVFTFLASLARSSAIDPRLVAPLFATAAAGVAQLVAARASWRGESWPRGFLLGLVTAEVVALIFGYTFAILGLIFAGTAAGLLWRSDARRYSAAAFDAPRHR
ncbi:hypothetical protein [Glaciibacter superstes]|uniref:hypothetical protein n=1 Tax=Glaciibacter superstes TaxID=501023 RepID=UPI0012FA74DB|nr:hypothetical protein [Glaciibacter superstes]